MKAFLLFMCLGFFFGVTPLEAQKRVDLSLWPKGTLVAGKEAHSLAVYLPDIPNGMAVIMCPGGGYDHLASTYEGHDMASWFAKQGVIYAVLEYRLPNGKSEVPLTDAEQAVRLLRSKAAEWSLNPHRIGIMGASAGGHLAASLATLYGNEEVRPDFQILLYPVISMQNNITNIGSRNMLLGAKPSTTLLERYSLEKQVSQETPQAFIVLSDDDKGVLPMNSIRYYLALHRCGVPVALHIYTSGGHGWGFKDSFLYKEQWTHELAKWLRDGLIW
ncbi:alpha/beta hydrolase [uncultured Bacteroides sp.]|uniref:alpha/beta hydrolase n=1 Tax=uncultured Bacteroides sp. TaxID=162156 RepID=UPI002AA5E6D1|nr:alpha/beta hydrolase [uncultured Bacteroides sp.]